MNDIPIAAIRRLTLHDGPGTRTTVFVKGCPLHCRWCHNPECISATPQLLFHDNLCVGCGKCAEACPHGEQKWVESQKSKVERQIDRSRCRLCGKCVEACWRGALEICGRDYDPEELLRLLIRDKAFYDATGGGVTVSGGEPLLYAETVGHLFALLKQNGVRTALDTCGDVHFDAFEAVLPATDLVLYDIKGMDSERHRAKYRAAGLTDTMPDVPAPNAAFLEERAVLLRRRLHVPVISGIVAHGART